MATRVSLVEEVEAQLNLSVLDRWFPACLRPKGFHQSFDQDWSPCPEDSRFLVFQSRMTWVAATLAGSDHARRGEFASYARHGAEFLTREMVLTDGATRWQVDRRGCPEGPHGDERHAYGSAFSIYALAAVARSLGCSTSLSGAQTAFGYLERYHHDPVHQGYYEATDLCGEVKHEGDGTDAIGTPYGWKSQNTHLHLLEAFTELVRVWPDELLRFRVAEIVDIFLGPLRANDPWLHVYAAADWTPVPGDVSHGHNVEAAHLLLDAARTIDYRLPEVEAFAKDLIDYALATGWHEAGGFFYTGTPSGQVVDDTKNWWAQAEGLLGLATVYRLDPQPRYLRALEAQWDWIRDYQIDSEAGGWFESVAPSGEPRPPLAKGHRWKAAYHDGRSLLFTSRLLREV